MASDQAVGQAGQPGPESGRVGFGWRRGRLRWWLVGCGPLAALTLALAVAVPGIGAGAAGYEPLGYGSTGNSAELYPGLPAGAGIHPVNTVGGLHEDIYIPPQRGTFSLFADVRNNGSHAVTIESVSLPPGGPVLAGAVRYSTPGMGGSDEIPPPTSRVLHNVVLRAGQEMFLGFPVRTWPCARKYQWTSVPSFTIKERSGTSSHTVAVPWGRLGDSLVLHAPGGRPGDPAAFCLPRTVLPK